MKSKKVAIYGMFGQQNLGNECTLDVLLAHVRAHWPDVEFQCICTGPADAAQRHGVPVFPAQAQYPAWLRASELPEKDRSLFRIVRKVLFRVPIEVAHWVGGFMALRRSAILFVPGTGLLNDFHTSALGWPYDIWKWSLLAWLCGARVRFVSVGAGPIRRPLSRWLITRALKLADYRSYRDTASKEYLHRIGFDGKGDSVYPDLAFSLPRPLLPDKGGCTATARVVGVGLMDYHGQDAETTGSGDAQYWNYLENVSSFVLWLLQQQYAVRILIGDAKFDTSVVADFFGLLKKRGVKDLRGQIISEPIRSVDELLSQLARTDVVVSARFHNVLLALMLGKPSLALSYHPKMDSLMSAMDLSPYCLPLEGLEQTALRTKFLELEKNNEAFMPGVARKAEEFRAALDEQYGLLTDGV